MSCSSKRIAFVLVLSLGLLASMLASPVPAAESKVRLVKGQTVYVPAYSDIYYGDRERSFYLTVTLCVRNTDSDHPVTITTVDYYDSAGKLIKHYLENDVKLGPLASTRYIVKESDQAGGFGASFIVRWKSDTKVTEPIVESIMIGAQTQQGVSFTSRGQVIKEVHE